MILEVPYYSQRTDVFDPDWQKRACAMACLKMTLDFLGTKTPSLDEMIQQGVALNAYGPSGWIHEGLAKVALAYGKTIEPTEFRSEDKEEAEMFLNKGIIALVRSLAEGIPVPVSAIKEFKHTDKFHMVILVGAKTEQGSLEGFYYHDSDANSADEGKNKFVPLDTFKKHWRRMALVAKK